MKTIDAQKLKIGRSIAFGLTGTNPQLGISLEAQIENILNWTSTIPQVIANGAKELPKADGLRWVKTDINPPVRNLIASYMSPGNDACLLAAPIVRFGGNQDPLFEYIYRSNLGMAWASYVMPDTPSDAPAAFMMSKSLAAHLITSMPTTLTFASNAWARWIHDWLTRHMLPHRYFDARNFGLITMASETPPEEVSPILNAYAPDPASEVVKIEETPSPAPKKRGRPKKK